MKNPFGVISAVLSITVIALAAFSLHLWDDRERLKDELAGLKSAKKPQGRAKERSGQAKKTGLVTLPPGSGEKKTAGGPQGSAKQPVQAVKKNNSPMAAMAEMMKDPKMRKAMEAQQLMGIEMMYSSLFDDLELTGNERSALKELLLEKQLNGADIGIKFMSGQLEPEEMKKLAEETQVLNRATDEKIKEFFGENEDRFARYELYNETHGERMELQSFKRSLAAENLELTAEKEQQLMDTMYQSRKNFEFSDDIDFADQGNLDWSAISEEALTRNMEERQKLRDHVYQSASAFLDEDQLRAFRTNQETSRAREEMGYRMAIRMFATPDNAEATPTP